MYTDVVTVSECTSGASEEFFLVDCLFNSVVLVQARLHNVW